MNESLFYFQDPILLYFKYPLHIFICKIDRSAFSLHSCRCLRSSMMAEDEVSCKLVSSANYRSTTMTAISLCIMLQCILLELIWMYSVEAELTINELREKQLFLCFFIVFGNRNIGTLSNFLFEDQYSNIVRRSFFFTFLLILFKILKIQNFSVVIRILSFNVDGFLPFSSGFISVYDTMSTSDEYSGSNQCRIAFTIFGLIVIVDEGWFDQKDAISRISVAGKPL